MSMTITMPDQWMDEAMNKHVEGFLSASSRSTAALAAEDWEAMRVASIDQNHHAVGIALLVTASLDQVAAEGVGQ
ncbi:hypothetical protein ACFSKY_06440 [Azotobacter chroococcum]|uniref:Uncharacterized protein n=1 Tax=Azotobacter chroococcum TaxID=353 RepID=A0A4R1PMK5_9GAMM|nr:hypothetical protein [Azotobacter chroococcum]TBV91341.1 hypothetical protein E0E53_21650 [Azotobacter chroococcum]TCL32502.1 hypothetical protein EV691_10728 [Azotobacter chroococcum]